MNALMGMMGGGAGGMGGMGGMGGPASMGGAGGMGGFPFFGGMGGMGGMGSPGAGAGQGGLPTMFNPAAFTPPSQETPEQLRVKYAAQLEAMKGMGFINEETNIEVLKQTNGNVEAAIDRLLGMLGN